MLELVHPVEKSVSEGKKSKKISLVEMVKKDPELRDFFKLVYQEDLREMALRGIKRKILAKKSQG